MKIQISGLLPTSLLIHSLINSIPDDNCSCCKHTSGKSVYMYVRACVCVCVCVRAQQIHTATY